MILNNAHLVTFWPSRPVVEGALIAIEGKSIVDFDKVGKLIDRYDDAEVLDVGGRVVVPGGIDAHRRLSRSLAVGMLGDPRRLDRGLKDEARTTSALVSLLDAVRAGVTTVFAFQPGRVPPKSGVDPLRRAIDAVGVRASLARATSRESDVQVLMDLYASESAAKSEMFRPLIGLEVSVDLGDDMLKRIRAATDEVGAKLHVVLADARDDVDAGLSRWGATPVGRLARLDMWDPHGFSVHAKHRLAADDAVLRDAGVTIVDCPHSDVMAGAPAPDLAALHRAQALTATGTDGDGGGLFDEFRLASLRAAGRGSALDAAIRLGLWSAFYGNARMATAHFGPTLGTIRPGARADLVVLDYVPSTPLTDTNFLEHLYWRGSETRVHTVIVNGRILYHNGQFTGVDEARARARAREISKQLWERI